MPHEGRLYLRTAGTARDFCRRALRLPDDANSPRSRLAGYDTGRQSDTFGGLQDLPEFRNGLMFLLRREPRRGGTTDAHLSSSLPSRSPAQPRTLLTTTHAHADSDFHRSGVPCSCFGYGPKPRHTTRCWTGCPGPNSGTAGRRVSKRCQLGGQCHLPCWALALRLSAL